MLLTGQSRYLANNGKVASLTKVFQLPWQHGGITWRVARTLGMLGGCSNEMLGSHNVVIILGGIEILRN
jgi:hypothetical protein